MSTIINKRTAAMALACTIAATALAFPARHYAASSQLAQGKWVKIAIPTTGVYELTDDELLAMGFENPGNVQVYGRGGNVISETLDGEYPDDMSPVSVARLNGKLCFYGLGPTQMTIADPRTTMPRYMRTNNPYSTCGYYFLHENPNGLQTVDIMAPSTSRGQELRSTSLNYFLYEKELWNKGSSGKDLLGEDITSNNLVINYSLPGNVDNVITVNTSAAVKSDYYSYVRAYTVNNGKTLQVRFPDDQCKVVYTTDNRVYYYQVSPVAQVQTDTAYTEGAIKVAVECPLGSISLAKLDYILISYNQRNVIGDNGQVAMGITASSTRDCIQLPGASSSTVVWKVDYPEEPVQYALSTTVEGDSVTGYEFTPRLSEKSSQYVAFDPEQTLLKVQSFEPIDNQDLHAMPTPDMLIITDKVYMEQAQRIAQLHHDVDGMDVAVVDQQQVFNEFTSGTPDAMAYRMICKMFYDRDKTKFRNLLLFGSGSYDNRGLVSNKPNRLLTYQSDNSNHQDLTYVSDDFFGFLDDDSGSSRTHYNDMVRIGIGRYPVANVAEARADVDKLIKYVSLPDYGAWRNDALIVGDTGDKDTHIFEAEGINNLIETSLNTQMNTNKVYVDMFQRSVNDGTTSSEARRRLIEYLDQGQYFMTYVGHAGPLAFTGSKLWTSTIAQNTSYNHLPILTTACCEVARYDSDQRGIAEHMFHKPNGGAIAMLTTPRQVYNNLNDLINQSFVKSLFNYSTTGSMGTLGETYMNAKHMFGYSDNGNKLCYTLLGDPAIKVNYPKPFFDINTVNGTDATSGTSVSISPLQTVTVTAQVKTAEGTVDADFNGDATLTLYDAKRLLKTVTQTELITQTSRDIFYPRDIITRVTGRVENGNFTCTFIVPRHEKAIYENAIIRVYAHKDNSSEMVNGQWDKIVVNPYNEATAIQDNNAPVIQTMYLNDQETFEDGGVVPANSTLYISATDDYGINTQSASVGNALKLLLDGGKTSYYQVKNNAVATDEGRTLNIAFPVNELSEGIHTLTFTVFDVAGNSCSRTISFIVSGTADITLAAQELPAVDKATFTVEESVLATNPVVNIKVADAQGNIVWTKSTSTFPVEWNLTDKGGNRVKAGLYKFFGSYESNEAYGGTNIGDLIVIDPVKNNKQ